MRLTKCKEAPMSEWTSKTIQHGNCTIVIHRPVLTKEEAAKRARQVQTVLGSTMRNYINRKETT